MTYGRIESLDLIRGGAVFWMIFVQILDFFSNSHIMSVTFQRPSDFWLLSFDRINWLPAFLFVSGICAWLMATKHLSSSKPLVFLHGLKRYGVYLLISLILCFWCFHFQTFLYLNEVVGAIGVYAIVTLLASLIVPKEKQTIFFISASIGFSVLGFVFHSQIDRLLGYNMYKFYWILPFFFSGAGCAKFVVQKKKEVLKRLAAILLIVGSIFLLLEGNVSYSNRTFSFVFLNSSLLVFVFSLLPTNLSSSFAKGLSFMGRNSLFLYLFHFAVFYKIATFFNIFQRIDLMPALLFTISGIGLAFISLLCFKKVNRRLFFK